MLNSKLTDIQKILGTSNILTCFSGKFSQGLIEEMGEAVKKHMESEDRPRNDIFSVFSIFIEQTQNIKNYMATKVDKDFYSLFSNSSIVCIGNNTEEYFIWSGNLIEKHDIEKLESKLKIVSNANKEELKQLYKEQLKKNLEPNNAGAGIGLIEIARKARKPIQYHFEYLENEFAFYEIKVIV